MSLLLARTLVIKYTTRQLAVLSKWTLKLEMKFLHCTRTVQTASVPHLLTEAGNVKKLISLYYVKRLCSTTVMKRQILRARKASDSVSRGRDCGMFSQHVNQELKRTRVHMYKVGVPQNKPLWTYLVFLLQTEHGSQVLGRDTCLADALLLHNPGFLFLMVLQEMEEVASVLQPGPPDLTTFNQAEMQVHNGHLTNLYSSPHNVKAVTSRLWWERNNKCKQNSFAKNPYGNRPLKIKTYLSSGDINWVGTGSSGACS